MLSKHLLWLVLAYHEDHWKREQRMWALCDQEWGLLKSDDWELEREERRIEGTKGQIKVLSQRQKYVKEVAGWCKDHPTSNNHLLQ